ncbi:MAG: molybdenum cofactor guanylyltransferase [Kofleriaceae bacterium]|nr:molybdenum cofactor guanylyltransferase [Kofleriaceae bacterium]
MIGVILAGGQARRYAGAIKPLLEIDQRTIFDRQCEVLSQLCDHIVIAAQQPVAWSTLPVVLDCVADGGPLAGIHAALQDSQGPASSEPADAQDAEARNWHLVVAGDMPNLRVDVLALLVERIASANAAGAGAIAFMVGARPQPLCTLFHHRATAVIAQRMAAGHNKVAAALLDPAMATCFVDESAVRAIDPALACFHNINSPSDILAPRLV